MTAKNKNSQRTSAHSTCLSHILHCAPHSEQDVNKLFLHPCFPSILSFLPTILFSPPRGLRWRLSRCSDTSACSLWYSSTRFAWSPRSGTNSLFNPLIIIKGINKFGWKTTPWTLSLYPRQKFIFFTVFFPLPPVAWWQKVLLFPAARDPKWATDPLAEWGEHVHSAYSKSPMRSSRQTTSSPWLQCGRCSVSLRKK